MEDIYSIINHWTSKILSYKYGKQVSIALGVTSTYLLVRKILDTIYRKIYNYPPGAVGLPFYGTYLWIGQYSYLLKLQQRYGNIFMINIGFNRDVFVLDSKISKQLTSKLEFSDLGRAIPGTPNNGLSFSSMNGKLHFKRRQLLHKSFMLILDSKYLTKNFTTTIEDYLFKKYDEKCVDNKLHNYMTLRADIQYSVFSLMYSAFFNDKLPDRDSQDIQDYFRLSSISFKQMFYSGKLSLFFKSEALITKLVRFVSWLNGESMAFDELKAIGTKWIKKYKMKQKESNNNSKSNDIKPCLQTLLDDDTLSLTEEHIASDIVNLFMAGNDSTSEKSMDCLTWLAKYPSLQNDLYQEITQLMKKYNNDINEILLKHLNDLNLLRALVVESMRYFNYGSIDGAIRPRYISKNGLKIGKYNIPKGCNVVIPYAYQLHDKNYWNNPYKFDLKNYLDENNKYKPNTIAANQFGQGKRQCPGMQFAKRMIYIIVVKLILRYEFYAKDNNGDNIHIEQWNGTGIARKSLKKTSIGIRKRDNL